MKEGRMWIIDHVLMLAARPPAGGRPAQIKMICYYFLDRFHFVLNNKGTDIFSTEIVDCPLLSTDIFSTKCFSA